MRLALEKGKNNITLHPHFGKSDAFDDVNCCD